jgi:hypothetical protein
MLYLVFDGWTADAYFIGLQQCGCWDCYVNGRSNGWFPVIIHETTTPLMTVVLREKTATRSIAHGPRFILAFTLCLFCRLHAEPEFPAFVPTT